MESWHPLSSCQQRQRAASRARWEVESSRRVALFNSKREHDRQQALHAAFFGDCALGLGADSGAAAASPLCIAAEQREQQEQQLVLDAYDRDMRALDVLIDAEEKEAQAIADRAV